MNNQAEKPGVAGAADLTFDVADYADEQDTKDLVALLDGYARDPMGGGSPLAEHVRERVVSGLRATPGAFSIIARIEGAPAALANCFTTYSTFAAAPVVNIHDLAVASAQRGLGIGKALLSAVEAEAHKRGACKITLEVLDGNAAAMAFYASSGFGDYQLDPAAGRALFWQKKL